MKIKQTRDKNGIIINNLTIKSMNNKDNKKNENNEKKNSKFSWKKLVGPVMICLLFALIFLAGFSFGQGDWSNGLCNLLWAFVMFLTIRVYGKTDDLREKYMIAIKHGAYLFFKAKTAEMKVSYFENRFGNFEDLIKNEDNDAPENKEEKDPNPPSFEESHGEPAAPASSAAANEETEMGHIAEGVGSHD